MLFLYSKCMLYYFFMIIIFYVYIMPTMNDTELKVVILNTMYYLLKSVFSNQRNTDISVDLIWVYALICPDIV